MDLQIALLLSQDGIVNGAVYALLALALVLVFTVTRVIFIPQGEFVAYGALTMASLQAGKVPGTIWLLLAMGCLVTLVDLFFALRWGERRHILRSLLWNLFLPLGIVALVHFVPVAVMPMPMHILLTLAIVVPMGPMLYRLAFLPLAESSVLVLLVVAVAVHFVLVGLGLFLFGPEGSRTPAFTDAVFNLGLLYLTSQSLWVMICSLGLILALERFFHGNIYGKALRATAMNRTGARLLGIAPTSAGKLAFALASLIGAFSGVLVAPITTIYYDTGFLIGLKGFVGAIVGGMVNYPLAAAGAIIVGLLESFASFWASAFKEVIVFTLIIPVLLWRSLRSHHTEDQE